MKNLPEFKKIRAHLTTLEHELEELELKKELAAEQAGESKEALDDMIRMIDYGIKYKKTEAKISALRNYINQIEELPANANKAEIMPEKTLENDLYCNRDTHNWFVLAIFSLFKYQSTTKLLIEAFLNKVEKQDQLEREFTIG